MLLFVWFLKLEILRLSIFSVINRKRELINYYSIVMAQRNSDCYSRLHLYPLRMIVCINFVITSMVF